MSTESTALCGLMQEVREINWEKVLEGVKQQFGESASEPCSGVIRDVLNFVLLLPSDDDTVTWWLEIYSGPCFRPWELQRYLDTKIPKALKIAVRAVVVAFDQMAIFIKNHRGEEKCLRELPEWEQISALSDEVSRLMDSFRAVPGVFI